MADDLDPTEPSSLRPAAGEVSPGDAGAAGAGTRSADPLSRPTSADSGALRLGNVAEPPLRPTAAPATGARSLDYRDVWGDDDDRHWAPGAPTDYARFGPPPGSSPSVVPGGDVHTDPRGERTRPAAGGWLPGRPTPRPALASGSSTWPLGTAAPTGTGGEVAAPEREIGVRAVVAIALVAALLAGLVGAGIAAATKRSPRPSLAPESAVAPGTSTTTVPPTIPPAPGSNGSSPSTTTPSSGSGSGSGSGSSPSNGSGSTSPGTTASTAAMTGVVDITTTLAFGGGGAAGTGMLLSSDGIVLTNDHVVAGSSSITLQVGGTGKVYTATVIGTDETDDVAVLKVAGASGLPTVTIGTSTGLAAGQPVTAVGNALGQPGPPTVVQGAIRALDQTITVTDDDGQDHQLDSLIQTDAPLQPGDSGGPLLDAANKVIGMNTAASAGRRFRSGSTEGFAIAIDKAVAIAKKIQAGEASATIRIGPPAFLGVTIDPAGARSSTAGALVAGVEPGTPAASSGLAAGDTIVGVDATAITSGEQLSDVLGGHKPGDTVTLAWLDASGARRQAPVKLAAGPPR